MPEKGSSLRFIGFKFRSIRGISLKYCVTVRRRTCKHFSNLTDFSARNFVLIDNAWYRDKLFLQFLLAKVVERQRWFLKIFSTVFQRPQKRFSRVANFFCFNVTSTDSASCLKTALLFDLLGFNRDNERNKLGILRDRSRKIKKTFINGNRYFHTYPHS